MPDFVTVSQVNDYIDELIKIDGVLCDIWVKGEISGCKLHRPSGHMYFTLKDERGILNCVMFKSRCKSLNFSPADGQEVLARGSVAVFAPQGKYQLYVEEMKLYGLGELFRYLSELRDKLEKKGYFAPENKKPLSRFAQRIGIVTSQDGAALRDMWRILKSLHPGVEVVLVHSAVQGAEAPYELAAGIRRLNEYGEVDVIIIGRGGGSVEDLMAFNTEEVVKAIYESKIPVISAVGHEVDFCLADLAADVRAATPTQAAQIAVPDLSRLSEEMINYRQRLVNLLAKKISYYSEVLDKIMMRKIWQEPEYILQKKGEYLDRLSKDLIRSMMDIRKRKSYQLALAVSALENLSPLKVLQRGYAVILKDGQVVNSVAKVEEGERVMAKLRDGNIILEVKGREREELWKI
ncbi:Exodeoxyribonuclease VII large subunit [Thermosyntropha lipolytica DSM 11003]|uniref:Exodeoxyribonuclease 7 large subunit n=1 Tax=Thermosyntropha lipolytica DSM 11003 TaxID=1123382 RepID=A0A1M5LIQ1_9FIRM|nr:exodeoxyribonuclease VII large subunit [Thermosyntropha lipolytica]SHG64898.1 Exodeoxyribonuclease VII large subunit [Thermosyntropha lipolytica DSM 11003]